jgi:hypothetical protein
MRQPFEHIRFDRFMRTTDYFHRRGRTMVQEFSGSNVILYGSDSISRIYPAWKEGINPLDIKLDWRSFTFEGGANTVMISGDSVRFTHLDAYTYNSTHSLQIEMGSFSDDPDANPPPMSIRCKYTLSGPDITTVTVTNSETSPKLFTVVSDGATYTMEDGYIQFTDMSPMLYRQIAIETDFFHASISKERKMSLRINTGAVKLPYDTFVGITKLSAEIVEREAVGTNGLDPGFVLRGYVYHPSQPRRQLKSGVPEDECIYKSTTLYFDLYTIPPGRYEVNLFRTTGPGCHIRVLGSNQKPLAPTLQFHSRQHTDIGSFTHHVDPIKKPRHLAVSVQPSSSTDFSVEITVNHRKSTVCAIQLTISKDGQNMGLFDLSNNEGIPVIIQTLEHQLQPDYYDIIYLEKDTKIIHDTVTVFLGVYKSDTSTVGPIE